MADFPRELIGQLEAAGGEHVQEQAPDVLDLDVLRGWCEREERILRLQYEEGRLPARYEAELGFYPLTTMTNALRRWSLIKHVYRVRSENLEARETRPADKEAVAHLIIRREPVPLWICGRVIKVTSRSYAAMAEIAAEALALEQLDEDLRLVTGLEAKLLAQRRDVPPLGFGRRNALRRRARSLHALAVQIVTEQRWHRMALYAHAMTPSGAPAQDVQVEAPPWWAEVGPQEDAALLAALWEAGPGRYSKIGQAPKPRAGEKRGSRSEDFGWASLFAIWEPKLRLHGAPLQDADLAQLLIKVRAQAMTMPELDS